MTLSDLRSVFKRLEAEAAGKDQHKFMPKMVHSVLKDNGDIRGAEIRSDAGVIWRWPRGFRSRVPMGVKSVYQPFQRSATQDRRGVEDWSFGRESLW